MSATARPAPAAAGGERAGPPPGVAAKGLRSGAIGFAGSTILGVVQTAPAYSLAVTMGFLAATVALQGPAILILAFVPIYCMTVVEQEFVAREPDCGTVLGLAALWTFRAEVTRSRDDLLRKGLAPIVGTLVLGWRWCATAATRRRTTTASPRSSASAASSSSAS